MNGNVRPFMVNFKVDTGVTVEDHVAIVTAKDIDQGLLLFNHEILKISKELKCRDSMITKVDISKIPEDTYPGILYTSLK